MVLPQILPFSMDAPPNADVPSRAPCLYRFDCSEAKRPKQAWPTLSIGNFEAFPHGAGPGVALLILRRAPRANRQSSGPVRKTRSPGHYQTGQGVVERSHRIHFHMLRSELRLHRAALRSARRAIPSRCLQHRNPGYGLLRDFVFSPRAQDFPLLTSDI